MPLVQKTKEETPALPLWLARDVPHERELACELLEQMGREKSLNYLLHLHDKEETRRQKQLNRYNLVALFCGLIMLLLSSSLLYVVLAMPVGVHLAWLCVFTPMLWIGAIGFHLMNLKLRGGRRKKTPWFSSTVQQNVITSLLDYAASPLVADALSRATVYYTGDRNRLFERLTHVLPLLPDDPDALTKYARLALMGRLASLAPSHYPGEKERIPALRTAIKDYFARTGNKPAAGSKRDLTDGKK